MAPSTSCFHCYHLGKCGCVKKQKQKNTLWHYDNLVSTQVLLNNNVGGTVKDKSFKSSFLLNRKIYQNKGLIKEKSYLVRIFTDIFFCSVSALTKKKGGDYQTHCQKNDSPWECTQANEVSFQEKCAV